MRCVRNLGPLWSQSMFSFESNNATISRYVKGNNSVLLEVCTRYMVHKETQRRTNPMERKLNERRYGKKIILSANELAALSVFGNISINEDRSFKIYCVYTKNKNRFTSIYYTGAKKRIDYVVGMKDKAVGKVKFYFELGGLLYALLEIYEYTEEQIYHIHEIKPTNTEVVYFADQIERKFIYIPYMSKHYVTEQPNPFESD